MPRLVDWLRTAAIASVCVAAVASVRARAAAAHQHVRETSDVFFLPPPKDVLTLSFGYRSALADVLWAHVLVSQGLHTMERRRFDNVAPLIDTINELEPSFREPYLLSDALINIQYEASGREDVLHTREILERGTRNLPLDPEVWRTAGQFLAFIAPASYITDPAERDAWRAAGARMLARAAELGGDSGYAGWAAISGAGILSKQGERDAAIRFLERTLAVTEEEELRGRLQKQLAALVGESKLEAYRRRQADFAEVVRRDVPFVGRSTLLVLGPPFDVAYCAGGAHEGDRRCAQTWRAWNDLGSEPGAALPNQPR